MGNCSFKQDAYDQSEPSKPFLFIALLGIITKAHFNFSHVIGRGGFGKVISPFYSLILKVWKVDMKKNGTPYAMKEMSKARIITKRSVNSVMNERKLL